MNCEHPVGVTCNICEGFDDELNQYNKIDDLQFHKQLIADIFVAKIDMTEHTNLGPVEDLSDYSIVCAGILIGKIKEHFEELTNDSPEDIKYVPASIDFSNIPEDLEGQWVIVDRLDRELLGYGDTLLEAFSDAGIDIDDIGSHSNIVVAKMCSKAILGGVCIIEKKND